MKNLVLVMMLLMAFNVSAQFKLPSRDAVKKEVKKEVNKEIKKEVKDLKSDSNKKSSQPKETTPIPTEEASGPAKGQINTFWKQIAKMRNHTKEDNKQVVYSGGIQSAQMSLNNTKTKDPNYDTSQMEKALQECQEVYNALDNAKYGTRDSRMATVNASETLFDKPFIFNKAYLNIGGDKLNDRAYIEEKLKESDAVIEDYKNQIDAFLASNPEKKMYQNDQSAVAVKAGFAVGFIKKAEDVFKNYRTLGSVTAYQDLLICKNFIESVKKVFPQEPALDANLTKLNQALQQYGSRESFMNKMGANQKEFVKNLRMGKAVTSNPAIEKSAKQQFESADMSSQKYTVTKVNIVNDWKLTKNELDIPLYKELFVNLAIKFADGKCGLANAWMRQDYEGGGKYGSAQLTMPGAIQELPCENLK